METTLFWSRPYVDERDNVTLEQEGLQRMVVRDGNLVTLDNMFSDERAMDTFFA